jgi:general secretion pathway protein A
MPFDDEALRRIHQLCHGVPRRINVLCDRALLVAQQTGRRGVDGDLITQAAREVFDEAVPQPLRTVGETSVPAEASAAPLAGPAAATSASPTPSPVSAGAPAAPGLRGFAAFVTGGTVAAAALLVGLGLSGYGGHAPAHAPNPSVAATASPEANGPPGHAAPSPVTGAVPAGGMPSAVGGVPHPEPPIAATPAAVERPGFAPRPASPQGPASPDAGSAAAGSTAAPSPATVAGTDLDALFTPASRDEAAAWRELAQLWGAKLPPGDACAVAPQRGLRCYQAVGWLGPVRLLQRPGVLTLADAQGRVAHVLLLALNEQHARVRAGGVERELPIAQLERLWRGDFATLWRLPPGYGGGDAADDSPFANWLAERLPQVAASGGALPHGLHGLAARVFAFQLAHGLPPDGLPGPLTVMQINRASGVDEPKLLALR